jgi:lipoyl(octanoyl) transferase 2
MSLPPIIYHYFPKPLPYLRTLQLQESIHALQLQQRRTSSALSHRDVLLLLQHKPVYTGGRRQTESETAAERARLQQTLGADLVLVQRGGELTYHGPGQLVGYPLLDLGRAKKPAMGIRDYICRLQRMLTLYLREAHGLVPTTSEHTGVFLGAKEKVASIGVQVRHRLTTHGFAMNVTREPRAWFDEIVACGLADVKAVSVECATGRKVEVGMEVPAIVDGFGRVMERQMVPLEMGSGDLAELVHTLEQESREDERTEISR